MLCHNKILTTNKAVVLFYAVSHQYINNEQSCTVILYCVTTIYLKRIKLYRYLILCHNNILQPINLYRYFMLCDNNKLITNKALPLFYVVSQQYINNQWNCTVILYCVTTIYLKQIKLFRYLILCHNNILTTNQSVLLIYVVSQQYINIQLSCIFFLCCFTTK
jgi:hypothetical protein